MAGHAPAADRRGDRAPGGARQHPDAAHRGRGLGRRGAAPALRHGALAVHAVGDRRQPRRASGSRARSPGGPRSWSSTTATTAPSTRRSSRCTRTAAPGRGRATSARPSIPPMTTRVVEFNDLARAGGGARARRRGLRARRAGADEHRDRAARARLPRRLRDLTRAAGTLLVIDETHTMSAGPGGYTAAEGLEPDLLTVGKAIGRRRAVGAFGMTAELATASRPTRTPTTRTWAASAARWPATRSRWPPCAATLEHVLTPAAFEGMFALAHRFTDGVREALAARRCCPGTSCGSAPGPSTASLPSPRATAARPRPSPTASSRQYLHLFCLNRGVLHHAVPQHGADVTGDDRGRTWTATPRCSPPRWTSCIEAGESAPLGRALISRAPCPNLWPRARRGGARRSRARSGSSAASASRDGSCRLCRTAGRPPP